MFDRAHLDQMIAALRDEQRQAQSESTNSPKIFRDDLQNRTEQISALIRNLEWQAIERQAMEDEATRGPWVTSPN